MSEITHIKPTEKAKEWLEKVNQIADLNFRCPSCNVPLSIAVCEILFADKDGAKDD